KCRREKWWVVAARYAQRALRAWDHEATTEAPIEMVVREVSEQGVAHLPEPFPICFLPRSLALLLVFKRMDYIAKDDLSPLARWVSIRIEPRIVAFGFFLCVALCASLKHFRVSSSCIRK